MNIKGIELRAFHAIWWTLAVLLPDLAGLALRDWRAAVAGAVVSIVMIVLSVRVSLHPPDAPPPPPPVDHVQFALRN